MTTRKTDTPDESGKDKDPKGEKPKSPEFKDQTAGKVGGVSPEQEKQAQDKGYIGQTPDDIENDTA